MNKTEFASIAMAMRTYYPRENLLPNDEAMDLWFDALKELNANIVAAALKRWVKKQKFSPSIAELIEESSGAKYELAMEHRRRTEIAAAEERKQIEQGERKTSSAVDSAIAGWNDRIRRIGGGDNA